MNAASATTLPDEARPRTSRETSELVSGATIGGRYRVEGTLAMGGYGTVHRARHLELNLPVAIKVLATAGEDVEGKLRLEERFAREARTLARIHHRNVLAVHDSGVLTDGTPYLVSELIDGEDLERRIARGPMSVAAIVDLGRQLFAGLSAIAEAGVLHRDIKPANVMLHRESDGYVHVKLIDFGIALAPGESKLTSTGLIVGTPHYMSPEQLRGEALDGRLDLYAASAVLYEALTSRPPFDGENTSIVIGKILGAPLTPILGVRPDCPVELAMLIERGLSKTSSHRPSSPAEFAGELDHIVEHCRLATGAFAWAADEPFSKTTPAWLAQGPGTAERAPSQPLAVHRLESDVQVPPTPTPTRVGRAGIVALPVALVVLGALSWASRSPPALVAIATPSVVAQAPVAPPVAPVDVDALLRRGLEALARGEVEVALGSYRAACDAAPGRAESYRGRGLAAASAGLDDEAISSLERYLSLAPDASDADRVRTRLRTLRGDRGRHEAEPP